MTAPESQHEIPHFLTPPSTPPKSTLTAFTLFSKLSPEIRQHIFDLVEQPQRLVSVDDLFRLEGMIVQSLPLPRLLHVNRESRQVMLRKYSLLTTDQDTNLSPMHDVLLVHQVPWLKRLLRELSAERSITSSFLPHLITYKDFCRGLRHIVFEPSEMIGCSILRQFNGLQTVTTSRMRGDLYYLSSTLDTYGGTMARWQRKWKVVRDPPPQLHLMDKGAVLEDFEMRFDKDGI